MKAFTEDNLSTISIIKKRLTWLIIGLITSLILSGYINQFEEILKANVLIVAFIPMIVYLADAIGTQMESVIIRSFAQEKNFHFFRFIKKQAVIVSISAVVLAALGYIGSYLVYTNKQFSAGLGFAIFISAISSLLTGTVIPYIFYRFKEDPAEASGPVATVIQDAISILVYFFVFSIFL